MVNLLDTSMNKIHLIFIVRVYHLFFGILHRINEVFATLDIVEGVIIDSDKSNVINGLRIVEFLHIFPKKASLWVIGSDKVFYRDSLILINNNIYKLYFNTM